MTCSTCYPTTEFSWLTEFSAATEAEIVTAAADRACTVCYPSAPVVPAGTSRLRTPAEKATDADREAREARKTEIAAKKAASAIEPVQVLSWTNPTNGRECFDTIATITAAKTYLTNKADYGWQSGRPEDHAAVAAALAAKVGTTPEAEIAAAAKRAAKRR